MKQAKRTAPTDAAATIATDHPTPALKSQAPLAVIEPDLEEDAGAGLEGTDAASFAIPFLVVLQRGSPQVDKTSGSAVPGAEPGMLYSTVSGRLFDGERGVTLVPAAYQRRFLRWGPRGSDSAGFKGELTPEEVDAMRARGELKELDNRLYVPAEDGTVNEKRCDRVADVRNHFCVLAHDDGTYENVLLSLASTQIKKSRALMSALAALKRRGRDGAPYTPATFDTMLRLTTVPEKNDKGSWYGVRFEIIGPVTDPVVRAAAKALWRSVRGGKTTARYADAAAVEGWEEHGSGSSSAEF